MRPTLARATAASEAPVLAATLPNTQVRAADASSATGRPRVDIRELPVPPTLPADGACTHPTGCVSAGWGGIGSPGPTRDPKVRTSRNHVRGGAGLRSRERLPIINGAGKGERVSNTALGCIPGTAPALACVTWTEDPTLTGRHTGTKRTGPGGFTLGPSVMLGNDFQAVGTLTTTIDGTTHTQPANGS
ncbi:hypothetical protein AQJ64_16330 [Streptomyces griseoruber]|uniref:Uncharacterized protein n=2 Tax=Streptomyces griseoruber TaxID=1943 RepID=A0A101T1T5_9ACTN|nr:hypothetical protein AQJ64_16330 [Streptomyces griseoruber]